MPQKTRWIGAKQLRRLLVPIRSLKPDPKNARAHDKENLDAITRSLMAFGQLKPVVVAGGVVKAGNGMLAAAKASGFTHLAAITAGHLSPDQAKAYGVADNRTSDLSHWDIETLSGTLVELPENLRDVIGEIDLKPLEDKISKAGAGGGPGSPEGHPRTVSFSAEQWTIVAGAIAHVREHEQIPDVSPDGRVLELICAEFMSGAYPAQGAKSAKDTARKGKKGP